MHLYSDLTPWYPLVDPPEDHEEEAASYRAALLRAVPDAKTFLEIGAGAGNNAFHMKRGLSCVLSDISPEMLDLSRAQNPDCEHVAGDMRTLRLGRTFDTVFIHDAIMYMRTEEDLAAAIATAFVHLRPGGAAVIAPDCFREGFRDETNLYLGEDAARAVRCVQWAWDPDPDDTTYVCEYVFLLRENGAVRTVHDSHVEGLFPLATWGRTLEAAGFTVAMFDRPLDDDGNFDQVFLCRRP